MAGFRQRRKKSCYFTANKVQKIDWTDYELLKRFISDRGKILPRRVTGTKAIYQRELAVAIKRARHMALLPFVKEQDMTAEIIQIKFDKIIQNIFDNFITYDNR